MSPVLKRRFETSQVLHQSKLREAEKAHQKNLKKLGSSNIEHVAKMFSSHYKRKWEVAQGIVGVGPVGHVKQEQVSLKKPRQSLDKILIASVLGNKGGTEGFRDG